MQSVTNLTMSMIVLFGIQVIPSFKIVLLSRYFSEDATQEMLDEWRPLMCPFDVTMLKALFYFELFLPTSLPPELHHKGFR